MSSFESLFIRFSPIGHLHALTDLTGLEGEVGHDLLLSIDRDVELARGLEAGEFGGDGVGADSDTAANPRVTRGTRPIFERLGVLRGFLCL